MHPDIAQADFFDLPHGIREGSLLGPILFVIAVDDMAEELIAHPFIPPPVRARKGGGGLHDRKRAPGVWIFNVWPALLQFVDDAALLASRAAAHDHGDCEVLFQEPPTPQCLGRQKWLSLCASPQGSRTRHPPLLWTRLGPRPHVVAAKEKLVKMGGFPGGLPVLTALHLWTALILPYVYATASLLNLQQVARLAATEDGLVSASAPGGRGGTPGSMGKISHQTRR